MDKNFLKKINLEDRRIITIIIATILLIALLVGGLLFITRPQEKTEEIQSTIKITEQQKKITEDLSNRLINSLGNFGSNKDAINGNNVGDVSYVVSNNPFQPNEFWKPRSIAYQSVKKDFLPNSPIYYDDREVNLWNNIDESVNLNSYSIVSVSSVAQENLGKITVDGKEKNAIFVDVNFTTKSNKYMPTGSDSSWDGSYSILEKSYPDNKALLTFVESEPNVWKLYSIKNLNNEFLLASWKTPSSDAYDNLQFDYQEVGKITPDNPGAIETPTDSVTEPSNTDSTPVGEVDNDDSVNPTTDNNMAPDSTDSSDGE